MGVLLFLAAAIVFALGVFGVTPGHMSTEEVTDLGLLLLACGMLVGPAAALLSARQGPG